MRPIIHYIHVNKKQGCWTVHNSKGCFHFDEVIIRVPCQTVHKPLKKDNPRFFIKCKGLLQINSNGWATIS